LGTVSDGDKPLTCGPNHYGLYGTPTSEWCERGDLEIPKNIRDENGYTVQYTPWTVVPPDTPGLLVRLNPQKDVECLSVDGINCQVGATGLEVARRNIDPALINPLVCGGVHAKLYGFSGYESPGHWCARGKSYIKY
jgi:hypothetical protein